jgi:hypothetical protein
VDLRLDQVFQNIGKGCLVDRAVGGQGVIAGV